VNLSGAYSKSLQPKLGGSDERNYELVAELYQQLKKNYDDRRDYWTAGDFHYGEMEMKRLHSTRNNSIARWWHQLSGFAAWYRRLSEYGESYTRPLAWLGGAVLLFTLLYPLSGLRLETDTHVVQTPNSGGANPGSPALGEPRVLDYRDFSEFAASYGRTALFKHSFITAIDVAAFQRNNEYAPTYPYGHLLALAEMLVTSTLIALFLLALRRQFRR
jgi:hypothetical protein